jgi:hypothetical protein
MKQTPIMNFSPKQKPASTGFHLYSEFNTLFEPHVSDSLYIINPVLLDYDTAIKKILVKKRFFVIKFVILKKCVILHSQNQIVILL